MIRSFLILTFVLVGFATVANAEPPILSIIPQVAQPPGADNRFQVNQSGPTVMEIWLDPNTSEALVYDIHWLLFNIGQLGDLSLVNFTWHPNPQADCPQNLLNLQDEDENNLFLRAVGNCDNDGGNIKLGTVTGFTWPPGYASGGVAPWEGIDNTHSVIQVGTEITIYDYDYRATALTCQGCGCDVNDDGRVSTPDYLEIGMNYGMGGYPPYTSGDCTGDGFVGGPDFLQFGQESGDIGCCLGSLGGN